MLKKYISKNSLSNLLSVFWISALVLFLATKYWNETLSVSGLASILITCGICCGIFTLGWGVVQYICSTRSAQKDDADAKQNARDLIQTGVFLAVYSAALKISLPVIAEYRLLLAVLVFAGLAGSMLFLFRREKKLS